MGDNTQCCSNQNGPKKCAQVGSLTGSAISSEAAIAKATINAKKSVQFPNGAPCSDCIDPCTARGITGYVDPVALAKATIVSKFGYF